jgi:hypothetical protein
MRNREALEAANQVIALVRPGPQGIFETRGEAITAMAADLGLALDLFGAARALAQGFVLEYERERQRDDQKQRAAYPPQKRVVTFALRNTRRDQAEQGGESQTDCNR